jgi:hypothetical protein
MDSQPVAIIRVMGGLVFDAVFEEAHTSDMEVTDNPVETGVVVSDHAYLKPKMVTLSAGVSDVLLRPRDGDDFGGGQSRSRKAFELLKALQAQAEPFDLQTGLALYTNMVCTSIKTKQDKDSGLALIFEATLREVLIVSTQVVKYPPRAAGAPSRQAKDKKIKGEQQSKEVTAPAAKQSLLTKLGAMAGL